MKDFLKNNGLWILFAGAVIAVALALLSYFSTNTSPLVDLANTITSPFRAVCTSVAGWFVDKQNYYEDVTALKEENEALKQQIAEMEATVRQGEADSQENVFLRDLLDLRKQRRDLSDFETATVMERSVTNWTSSLTLDKGSSSGVNKDDLVTTVDGMLGFVSEVTDNTCEVTSITDPKMQCGALVTRTRETAIAEGDYNLMTRGALRLSYLREDSKVVVGDTVETSGRGGVFPKGILIGTVESVQPEESGLSYYAVIKPFVSVDSVSSVSIITEYTDTAE